MYKRQVEIDELTTLKPFNNPILDGDLVGFEFQNLSTVFNEPLKRKDTRCKNSELKVKRKRSNKPMEMSGSGLSLDDNDEIKVTKKVKPAVSKEGLIDHEAYTCGVCGNMVEDKYQHLTQSHYLNNLRKLYPGKVCKLCDKTFSNNNGLAEHMGTFHRRTDSFTRPCRERKGRPATTNFREKFKCPFCDKDLSREKQSTIEMHVSTSHFQAEILRDYAKGKVCTICGLKPHSYFKLAYHLSLIHI